MILTPRERSATAPRRGADPRDSSTRTDCGYVAVSSYPVDNPMLASPIRLVFQGLKARVADRCGQWPTDLASGGSIEGWKNEGYQNFGCATQSALAAQIDDPRDLVQARALDAAGRGDASARDRERSPGHTIRAPTGRPQSTPIGHVGGG